MRRPHQHLTHVSGRASSRPEPEGGRGAGAAQTGVLARAGTPAHSNAPHVAYPGYADGVALVTLPDGSEHVLDLVGICGAQAALDLARAAIEAAA